MEYLKTIEWLKERLQQPLPGADAHARMMARVREMPAQIPQDARASAVLSVLFPVADELNLLFIKRTEDGHAHSGQISFPGGRMDPTDADLRATALREAQEEVGIMSEEVSILGELTPLYIPVSNFQVHPFVAFAQHRPQYHINKSEVDFIIEIPLKEILSEEIKTVTKVTSPADPTFVRNVNAYQLPESKIIWGATAMILSELEVILEEIVKKNH